MTKFCLQNFSYIIGYDIFPTNDMDNAEKLNCMARLIIIITIVLYIFYSDQQYWWKFLLFGFFFILYLHNTSHKDYTRKYSHNFTCEVPEVKQVKKVKQENVNHCCSNIKKALTKPIFNYLPVR